MEMSPLNSKILLSSGKSLREYRREGTESAGNSDIIASSIGSGSRKIKKSMSVATHSSSSSSISRGESLTVISGQLVTHTKVCTILFQQTDSNNNIILILHAFSM